MQTRRHSRRLNPGAASTSEDPETASAAGDIEMGDASAHLALEFPEDIDVNALQTLLPSQPLDAPTPDLIYSVYRLLLEQTSQLEQYAQERDAARADASRLEVELDQALQDQDVELSRLRETVEVVQKELAQTKAAKADNAKLVSLQAELNSLKTTYSSSSTASDDIRRQIELVQNEKRDLLGVVDTLREEVSQREDDTKASRATVKELRAQLGTTQNELAEVRAKEVTERFRLQSAEQELELVRAENTRISEELTLLQGSSSNDRRTKHAEVVRLQAQLDSVAQEKTAAESRLEAQRKATQSQGAQLEEALAKISNLQTELAQQAAAFRSESETHQRLNDLMERRNDESRRRLEEIEQEWDGVLTKAAETEAQLKEDLAKERQRADDLDSRLEELRMVTDVVRGSDMNGGGRASTPGPGTPGTPGSSFFLSPAANLAIKLQKNGRSYTEIYADYVRTSEDLAAQKEETRRLETALAQILTDIEERAPVIRNQQQEYARLQEEASLLTSQLADASAERDRLNVALRAAKEASRVAEEENLIFQKQLGDLGRQVRGLTREISIRDDPSLEHIEVDDTPVVEELDSEQVISDHLVLFRSLPQLQAQNQRLLKTSRTLAQQLERREGDIMARLREEESAALAEASDAIRDMSAELERQKTLVATYAKERDMLRVMANRKPSGALLSNGSTSHHPESITVANGSVSDLGTAQMLHEQQTMFEQLKAELGVDSQRLKEDLAHAQRERDANMIGLSKANAQLEYLQERIKLLQTSADMEATELKDQRERNRSLQDALNKSEMLSYHTSEELREARALAERLRHDTATMQAENGFLKSMEARLQESYETVSKERAQLQELVTNMSTIHVEFEKSGENEKKSLERQVKKLETQTYDLRDQVAREAEHARQTLLRKESEIRELQGRVSSLTEELHKSREAQSVAEANRVHLDRRCEDLERQLAGVQEKLAVYEGVSRTSGTIGDSSSGVYDETLLRAEIAELRAALKVAENDLAKARQHVEQFQSISQANEAALESLSATYEQFKLDSEKEIRDKTTELVTKTERLDTMERDLAATQKQRAELAEQLESSRSAFESDKRMLEAAIVDLGSVEDRALNNQVSVQQDLRRQTQIAEEAREQYRRELVAHAETVKANAQLKEELLATQTKLRESQTAAEIAAANVVNADAQWASQRESLQKELTDASVRLSELNAHNSALHQHLEQVNKQAEKIRQTADAPKTDGSATEVDPEELRPDPNDPTTELRSVIAYLRREKDILQLQHDLNKQENTRLRTHNDRLTQTIEDHRKQLTEERERASRSVMSADQHADLLEKIQQINLLRESNTTLRKDSEAHAKAAQKLRAELQTLREELNPLKEQVHLLTAEVETRDALLQSMRESNQKLEARIEHLVNVGGGTDPQELQSLKDQLEAVTKERDEQKSQAEAAKEATASLKGRLEEFQKRTQANLANMNGEVSRLKAERTTLTEQLRQAEQQTASAGSSEDVDGLRTELTLAQSVLSQAQQDAVASKQSLEASTVSILSSYTAFVVLISSKTQVSSLTKENEDLQGQLATLKKQYETAHKAMNAELASLQQQLKAQSSAAIAAQPADVQELIKQHVDEATAALKSEHEAAMKAATAAAAAPTTQPSADLEAIQAQHQIELQALEARLAEQHRAELTAAVAAASEAAVKEAVDVANGASAAVTIPDATAPSAEAVEAIVQEQAIAKVQESTRKESEAKMAVLKKQLERFKAMAQPKEAQSGPAARIAAAEAAQSANAQAESTPQTPASTQTEPTMPPPNTVPTPATPQAANATPSIPPKPTGVGRGNGIAARGASRGIRGGRGGGTTGGVSLGRGASQVLQNVNAATQSPPSQTSILGAAGAKRPREAEAETPGGGEAGTPKRPRGGGPVAFNRPPRGGGPGPSKPAPQS
ncbi:hypothetical protein DL93DRAFT_2054404 [Clavulina sp. PMI_390]|nr:hypothetical protein DL93DRAFT_2054404 [Clavulina sp. PMI_390]